MKLGEKIERDFREAFKGRDERRCSVLRMLRAALKNKEIMNRAKGTGALSEEDTLRVIQSEIRKRREAAAEYRRGNRPDRAKQEKLEAEILQSYLPAQLSSAEIQTYAEEAIREADAKGLKDIGRVMGCLMPKVRGRADGAAIQQIVRTMLQGRNI